MDLARLILGVDTRGLRDGERDLNSFSNTARGVAGAVGAAFAAIGFAQFGRQTVQAAIDAQEMESAFDVVFGNMSDSVRQWAETTGNALGRSTQEIQRGALAFQELFGKALEPSQAAELSKQFAVLTQDLASFKNLSNEVAQQKLFSGLVGEAEPLRAVGVFLSEAAVQAKAAELGLSGVNNELTDQEKIVARAAIIQEQLAQASGDVERTSGSAANQIKTYNAAVEELQVAIGTKLLPTLTPLITQTANIVTSMAQMAQGFSLTSAESNRLWNIVTTVTGAWAAYRVTLLAVAGVQAAYTSAMIVATRVIGGVQAATLGLNAALAANPFGAVAVAVGVLTGAFIALANSQEQARAKTNNLITSLKSLAEARSAEFTGSLVQARRQLKVEQERLAQLELQAQPGSRMARGGIEGPSPGAVKAVEDQRKRVKSLNREIMDSMVAYGEAEKAAQSIVVPTASATTSTVSLGKALSDTGGTASRAADDFQRLYDRLHPFEAAMRQLTADEMLIMSRKNLTDAEKDYLIALRRSEEFRKRTAGLGDAKVSDKLLSEGSLAEVGKVRQEFEDEMERLREGARRDTVVVADSFAQMAQRITSSLQGLANSIRSGDFLGILGGALDIFMQLGSAGVFGGGLQTRLNSVPGRANGGLVSSGRSYLVGERGPELFTPGATGFITPRAGNDNTRISVEASPYFDVRVNGQIIQAAPAIAQGGANVAQRQMGRAQSRRVPG